MGLRVAIAADVWSSNLGDALLHHCLAELVRRVPDVTAVVPIDLENRTGFADSGIVRVRRLVLPPTLRAATWWTLRRPRRVSTWSATLRGCDLLLIGGGQLLDDMGMLFPLRLAALAEAAAAVGTPTAVACCGVGPHWSTLGRRLVEHRLGRVLRAALVRDASSAASLARIFPAWPAATCAPDPAVWAGALFPAGPTGDDAPIGLGIAALGGKSTPETLAWWQNLATALGAQGRRCALFSNGSPEDEALLRPLAAATGLPAAPRPRTPAELVATIARHRVIASPRLHAAVTAFSLGRPACVLSAQPKAAGFCDIVGLPGRAIGVPPPAQAAEAIGRLADAPADPPELLATARQRTADAVAALVAAARA